ncbi:hypothetical protein AOQ84DRAFT_418908, partial [Glonium stellatum]
SLEHGPLLAVIEDAIKVIEELRLRLIWIDGYYIPQNDEEQKLALIETMD